VIAFTAFCSISWTFLNGALRASDHHPDSTAKFLNRYAMPCIPKSPSPPVYLPANHGPRGHLTTSRMKRSEIHHGQGFLSRPFIMLGIRLQSDSNHVCNFTLALAGPIYDFRSRLPNGALDARQVAVPRKVTLEVRSLHRITVDFASRVMAVLATVPGIQDTAVYRSLGQPTLLIKPDRDACSRYGINVGDVGAVLQAAIGGQAVTQVLEGDRRFDLVVRWLPQYRQSLDTIRQIRVSTPAGTSIPLSLVSDIETAEGASFIYREQLARYVPLRFAVRGRDLESAIAEANVRVAREVKLPESVQIEWAGEYGELSKALQRLELVIPFSLVLIAAVLYGATYSWIDTFIIMAQVPVACLGGILALLVTGIPFSVSAAVGFISIFGIAVMDGILLSAYIRQLWDQGHPFVESIIMGSDRRLRATMMTDLVDAVGFLPAALSTRIGAQTQRPLAVVVIGGAIAIAVLTRVLQPVLIYLCHRQLHPEDKPSAPL